MTTKYEVWYTQAEWNGGSTNPPEVFDTLEEAHEYVKLWMKIQWDDLSEEYPTIEDVKSHHLFASEHNYVKEAVNKYYTEDTDFSDIMELMKWEGYLSDSSKNIIEAYHEDWMLGCGEYTITESEE